MSRKKNRLSVWEKEKLDEIRKIFAPNLTELEFKYFVSLGKALGANPFTREIWAVKFKKDYPAQIFCGRDFYRRKAQSLPEYNGHICDAVYENDTFEVVNGEPKHTYNLKNRGALLGAYCVVYKKNARPYFVYVDLDEYNVNQSLWNKMPATMIKKVAEAQALRGAFQGTFGGTYDESEYQLIESGTANRIKDTEKLDVKVEVEKDIDNKEESPKEEMITDKQKNLILKLKETHLLTKSEKNTIDKKLKQQLTKNEASNLIESITTIINKRKGVENNEKTKSSEK